MRAKLARNSLLKRIQFKPKLMFFKQSIVNEGYKNDSLAIGNGCSGLLVKLKWGGDLLRARML